MRLQIPDAEIEFEESFLVDRDAEAWRADLVANVSWERQTLRIFGRAVPVPRLSAWYGDPGATYAYSGIRLEPLPWLPALSEIRRRLEGAVGCGFNSVLLNLYRDGRDGMGWHSDDEPELGREPTIASLSLGATRRFLLRHRERRELPTLELRPTNGSLILMSGATQRYWKHQVPKTTRPTEPRLNLTFRAIAIPGEVARQPTRPTEGARIVGREYS